MLLGQFFDTRDLITSLSPYGEIAVILIIFAETGLLIGFFLPGDSLLFTAGLLANDGKLSLTALLVGCFAGAVLGDQVGYNVGKRLGPALFRKPDAKLFRQEYVEHTKDFFEKHGPKTILLARFVPVVRTFAPVMAGVGDMRWRTFAAWNVIGGLVWAVGVTLAGYALSAAIGDSVDKYLLPIIFVVIVASLIPPYLEWRKHRRPKTAAEAEVEVAELEELLDED